MIKTAMKKTLLSLLALLSFSFESCNYGVYLLQFEEESVESRAATIDSLSETDSPDTTVFNSPQKYSFIVMTDVHIGAVLADHRIDAFLEWFRNQLSAEDVSKRPLFAISLGDNADGGHASEYEEFNGFASKMKSVAEEAGISNFMFYSTIGNHDLYNNGWAEFKERVYPYKSAYKFSVKNPGGKEWSFYVLDSANGTFGEKQRTAVKKEFAADGNPKLVFTHYPIYAGGNAQYIIQDTLERNIMLTLFQKHNVKHVFEGHAHKNMTFDYGTWKESVTPSLAFNNAFRLVTVDTENESVETKLILY